MFKKHVKNVKFFSAKSALKKWGLVIPPKYYTGVHYLGGGFMSITDNGQG